jgi:hypothetical protein
MADLASRFFKIAPQGSSSERRSTLLATEVSTIVISLKLTAKYTDFKLPEIDRVGITPE